MTKTAAVRQLLLIMHECNMASVADATGNRNDFPSTASRQNNAYGHVSKAIECLGGLEFSNHYCETGDIAQAIAMVDFSEKLFS